MANKNKLAFFSFPFRCRHRAALNLQIDISQPVKELSSSSARDDGGGGGGDDDIPTKTVAP